MALLLYTGQRRSDVILFGKQHVRDGWLKFTQQKNRKRKPVTLEIPVLLPLQRIIDATPSAGLTFLESDKGQPFSEAGFGNKFRQWCDEAELPHCSAHGLRKAGASIAATNGTTPHQLVSVFGWLSLKQAKLYTRAERQKQLPGGAMKLLLRGQRRNVNVSHLRYKSIPPIEIIGEFRRVLPRGGISTLGSKQLDSRRNFVEFLNLGAPRSATRGALVG
jgi:integrase